MLKLDFKSPPTLIPQDNIRFTFMRNVILVEMFLLLILIFINFFFHYGYTLYFIATLIFLIFSLIRLNKKKEDYQIVAKFIHVLVFSLCVIVLFTKKGGIHYQECFWMLLAVLFSFFVLNQRWGGISLTALVIIYIIYFYSNFETNFTTIKLNSFYTQLTWCIQFGISMVLMATIMIQYLKANKLGLDYIYKVNEDLEKDMALVEEQNQQKILLLQEIHHRVKNNLQIIISILRMQINSLNTKEAKEELQITINRIISLSLAHQKVYENKSLSEINAQEYLSAVVQQHVQNSKNLKITGSPLFLEASKIIYLGLIVNELLDNHNLKNTGNEFGTIHLHIENTIDSFFQVELSFVNFEPTSLLQEALELVSLFCNELKANFTQQADSQNQLAKQYTIIISK